MKRAALAQRLTVKGAKRHRTAKGKSAEGSAEKKRGNNGDKAKLRKMKEEVVDQAADDDQDFEILSDSESSHEKVEEPQRKRDTKKHDFSATSELIQYESDKKGRVFQMEVRFVFAFHSALFIFVYNF
jgi:hypothetical protein